MKSEASLPNLEPKPYAVIGDAILYNGDCLEILNNLPEKSVDMIFADPPYNLSNDGYTVHAGKRVSVNKGNWDKSSGPEKDFNFHFEWIEACKRVLKDDGTIWISGTYHSIYGCGYALQLQDFRFLNDVSWFKPNASPNLGCRMFTASHETLIWASKNKKSKHTFNYELMKNGDFPSDKIKNLLDRVVLSSTNPGDVVLDPFCGSATTGVSSLLNKRKFIGIDADEDYLKKLATPRLKDAEKSAKGKLF